jgi:hypothetical protein
VGEVDRLLRIVGHQYRRHRRALLHVEKLLVNTTPGHRVEARERFIEQQQFRMQQQSAAKARALLLAAREFMRISIGHVGGQLHQLEQVVELCLLISFAPPPERRRQ